MNKENVQKSISPIRVFSDWAGGTRGGAIGPRALEWEAMNMGSDFFEVYPVIDIQNEKINPEESWPELKNVGAVYRTLVTLSNTIHELKDKERFPVVISGDHSASAGIIAGLKSARPSQRLGVIYIDAHADIHSPYSSPSGNIHGMPLAASAGIDLEQWAVRQPDPEAAKWWKKLKNIADICPKISPDDIVFCAVRSIELAEKKCLDHFGIKNYTVKEIENLGLAKTREEIYKKLEHCDQVFISFDVDSMDPSESMGTGTPEPEGLRFSTAILLNEELIRDPKVSCWEITEINPLRDKEDRMARLSLKILENTVRNLIYFY